MRFHQCHCCGSTLLRHARAQGLYWYCPSCRQEMLPVTLNVKTVLDLPIAERGFSRIAERDLSSIAHTPFPPLPGQPVVIS